MANVRLGVNCKVYRNTATYGSPTWDLIATIRDCTLTMAMAESSSSTRESIVDTVEVTTISFDASGNIRVDDGADFLALNAIAFAPGNGLDLLVMNGATDSPKARGIRANWNLTNWSENQGRGEVLYKDFTLKPSIAAGNAVKTAVVADDGTSITYTAI